jgi:hypothetical protein
VRVWIDRQLVIDNWTDHSAKEDKGTIALQAGQKYDICVDYYENGGEAVAKLLWASLSQPKEVVPTTQLYPAEFLAGTEIRLLTNEASSVSPAWVEFDCGEDAASIQFSVNGGDQRDAVRLNSTRAYANAVTTENAPHGIPLDEDSPALLSVIATDGVNSQTHAYALVWSPTSLNGKSWSEDEILVRKGDSLLLTATGVGAVLTIDADGDGTVDFTGVPGDRFPYTYGSAGIRFAEAKIDGESVGSLTVKVLSVDLHVPIAAVLNYQRELDVYVQPAGETGKIVFQAANQTELAVGTKSVSTTGATLTLNPSVLTDSPLIARIGDANGPMIGIEPLEVFKMESLNNQLMAFTRDEDDFGTGVLRFKITPRTVIANDKPETPEVEGLFFDLTLRGSGICFEENGQTTLRVPSTREDEDGIIEVYIQISPNGVFSCHDITAIQINSPVTIVGKGNLNNPALVDAAQGLYLLREVRGCDETTRGEESDSGRRPNLFSADDAAQPNKQKYQVWDQDGTMNTELIGTYDNQPKTLEDAFFAAGGSPQKLLEGALLGRWFTVSISDAKSSSWLGPWAVRMEPSKLHPPQGGAMLADNNDNNLDEVVHASPGKLEWLDGKPRSYPAYNLCPTFSVPAGWAAQENGWTTYDSSFTKNASNPDYIDFSFKKGNMFGNMDAVIRVSVSDKEEYTSVLIPEERPSGDYSHKLRYDASRRIWDHTDAAYEARFPDLIRVGRLEADGWTGYRSTDGTVLFGDWSSRDKFPDLTGANVYRYQVEVAAPTPENPNGTRTETYVRTIHNGATGEAAPTPVHITFRAAPGEKVTAAVTLATKHETDSTKDGLKTHKAWVSLSPTDIFEYRGQPGDTDAQKVAKVFKVVSFQLKTDAAGNPISGSLDYTKPVFARSPNGNPIPAERVVTFTMTADYKGYAQTLVYVYGIEQTRDRLDELKLVVYGEERMGWKAKNLGTATHQNQNLALAEDSYRGGKTICRWWITDDEPVNVFERPHPPGDYSVDAQGKDCVETRLPWVTTKYYFTVDPHGQKLSTSPDDPDAGFNKVVNDLYRSNLFNLFSVSGSTSHCNSEILEKELSGSNSIDIVVDRFFQEGGAIAGLHIANGVISPRLKLRIMAELADDSVSLNFNGSSADADGQPLQLRPPGSGPVKPYEFSLPATILKTPSSRGSGGNRPRAVDNILTFNGSRYKIYWVELSFDAMSPYILVHGKGANKWYWRGFPPELGTEDKRTGTNACWYGLADRFENMLLPFDESISLGVDPGNKWNSQRSIVLQSLELRRAIPLIPSTFGTRHVNLICHSKGGLDSRQWLAIDKKGYEDAVTDVPKLVVGQFITLNTPHKGSVIADYSLIAANCSLGDLGYVEEEALAVHVNIRDIIASVYDGTVTTLCDPRTPATDDLQTFKCLDFNEDNMPLLAVYANIDGTKPEFWASQSDADLNGSGVIEGGEADISNLWEGGIPGTLGIPSKMSSWFYTALKLTDRARRADVAGVDGIRHLMQIPTPQPQKNDFLVSYRSAFPDSVLKNVFKLHYTYQGAIEGRMHGNIADDKTADKLRSLRHVADQK